MARSSSPAIGCSTDKEPLEALHPKARPLDIEDTAAHLDGFADPQAVPVDHQDEHVVADAMAPFLGGLEQLIDLRTRQEVLRSLVGIGRFRATLYFSSVGRYFRIPQKCHM